MLTGLLTAISVLSSGYTLAKRVLEDTKKNRPEAYGKLKKLPRSKRREFLDRELIDQAKKQARQEIINEMKEEYRLEIRRNAFEEMKSEAEELAWDQVHKAIKTDGRALKELNKLSEEHGISNK